MKAKGHLRLVRALPLVDRIRHVRDRMQCEYEFSPGDLSLEACKLLEEAERELARREVCS